MNGVWFVCESTVTESKRRPTFNDKGHTRHKC